MWMNVKTLQECPLPLVNMQGALLMGHFSRDNRCALISILSKGKTYVLGVKLLIMQGRLFSVGRELLVWKHPSYLVMKFKTSIFHKLYTLM